VDPVPDPLLLRKSGSNSNSNFNYDLPYILDDRILTGLTVFGSIIRQTRKNGSHNVDNIPTLLSQTVLDQRSLYYFDERWVH
jgi:hypothetical protein